MSAKATALRILLLTLAACAPPPSDPGPARLAGAPVDDLGGQRGLIGGALARAGLAFADVRLETGDFRFHDRTRFRPGLHELFGDNPWRISPYTRHLTDRVVGTNLVGATLFLHARTDARVRLGVYLGNPVAPTRARVDSLGDGCLAAALASLTGRPAAEFTGPGYDRVPLAVKRASALILFEVPRVLELRRKGLVEPLRALGLDGPRMFERALDLYIDEPGDRLWRRSEANLWDDVDFALQVEALADGMDPYSVNHGAAHGAYAVQTAAEILTEAGRIGGGPFRYEVDTAYGRVALGGTGDDDYGEAEYLLVVDAGGSDTHRTAGGNRSFSNPFSVVLDAAGDDRYLDEEGILPAFGAGAFGYGFAVDLAGDDRYNSRFAGEGFGLFGTGVLWDRQGDDRYEGLAQVQGSGAFGGGALVDNAGNDVYLAHRFSQGFGFTLGCGLLADGAGDDRYTADNEQLLYASDIYDPEYNVNMCQGFGYGRRADFTDGHSWAGGIGVLADGGGKDAYLVGHYGQGSAYWYGVGILVDKAGDDLYRSHQYATAAGPHYAIGILQDDAGDDRYLVSRRQSLGHARDFSIAWLEDGGGDDYYNAPGSCLGEGNQASIAVFWDKGGDDTYLYQAPGLGYSRPEHGQARFRDFSLCLGMFVDGGGRDRYRVFPTGQKGAREGYLFEGEIESLPPIEFAGDGRTWVQEHGRLHPTSYNVGVDAQ